MNHIAKKIILQEEKKKLSTKKSENEKQNEDSIPKIKKKVSENHFPFNESMKHNFKLKNMFLTWVGISLGKVISERNFSELSTVKLKSLSQTTS